LDTVERGEILALGLQNLRLRFSNLKLETDVESVTRLQTSVDNVLTAKLHASRVLEGYF
jgi:hypothetical protein